MLFLEAEFNAQNQPRETDPIRQLIEKLQRTQRILLRPLERFESAVNRQCLQDIRDLLQEGEIDPNIVLPGTTDAPSGLGTTLLHWEHCDVYLLQLLMDMNADVNKTGRNLHTPLLAQASHGNEGLVRVLLDANADPDSQSATLMTPLHLAVQAGNYGCLQLLLQRGADRSLVDLDNDTAFDCSSDVRVLQLLADGAQRLAVAVLKGDQDGALLLLREGVCSVNDLVLKDKTALHLACLKGQPHIAHMLLEQRADVNLVAGRYDFTPLHYAAHQCHLPIVQLLIAFDADINARDSDGNYPKDLA